MREELLWWATDGEEGNDVGGGVVFK